MSEPGVNHDAWIMTLTLERLREQAELRGLSSEGTVANLKKRLQKYEKEQRERSTLTPRSPSEGHSLTPGRDVARSEETVRHGEESAGLQWSLPLAVDVERREDAREARGTERVNVIPTGVHIVGSL